MADHERLALILGGVYAAAMVVLALWLNPWLLLLAPVPFAFRRWQ